MKPHGTAFTVVYTAWLEIFRSMIPGGSRTAPAAELSPKEAQAAANQEWEDEGGSVKPAAAPGPKIPF
jgi:hypothetical protein